MSISNASMRYKERKRIKSSSSTYLMVNIGNHLEIVFFRLLHLSKNKTDDVCKHQCRKTNRFQIF